MQNGTIILKSHKEVGTSKRHKKINCPDNSTNSNLSLRNNFRHYYEINKVPIKTYNSNLLQRTNFSGLITCI